MRINEVKERVDLYDSNRKPAPSSDGLLNALVDRRAADAVAVAADQHDHGT